MSHPPIVKEHLNLVHVSSAFLKHFSYNGFKVTVLDYVLFHKHIEFAIVRKI